MLMWRLHGYLGSTGSPKNWFLVHVMSDMLFASVQHRQSLLKRRGGPKQKNLVLKKSPLDHCEDIDHCSKLLRRSWDLTCYCVRPVHLKMTDTKGVASLCPDIHALQKEWDEISCPICMEHPHNAVLLVCTSHEKGCRSYICDTSYRHSNCLDRFKKLRIDQSEDHHRNLEAQVGMKCPLCRGNVTGWKVVKEVRQYWDTKSRSCSRESCTFAGNYGELRKHARRSHPMTRPADVDPTRQRDWRRMEHEREYGDILSAIRSAMPGALMFGDYAIDDGDDIGSHDRELGDVGGPWWATLFLFHMMSSSISSHDEFRASSRGWRRRRSSSGNRYLWGENLLGLQHEDDDDDDDDDEILMPRRRRRFTGSTPNEDWE